MTMRRTNALFIILLCFAAGLYAAPASPDPSYVREVTAWKQQREQSLRTNWLPLAGLFWLKEGESTFGSAKDNTIVLPRGPAHAGVFGMKEGGKVGAVLLPGVVATVNGKRVQRTPMLPEPETILSLGDLRMFVIVRGARVGVRLLDLKSPALKAFKGVQTFPLDPKWRVTADWVPSPGRKIPVMNVLGDVSQNDSPGVARFQVGGQTVTLRALVEEDELFFIFNDATSNKTTYGAGRYLYSAMPKDGKVVLDFNEAFTPPCGYTPYATCPLPPAENKLKVAIGAGERYTKH
jgi:uncharacterized protein (DUF1684 family)